MSLQILIGHEKPGQRGTAKALYVGTSGTELNAARAAATCGSFTILNNPLGLRKSNPSHNPAAPFPETPVTPVTQVNPVTLPEDITGLKKPELQEALVTALARIKELETAAAAQIPQQPLQEAPGTDDTSSNLTGLED